MRILHWYLCLLGLTVCLQAGETNLRIVKVLPFLLDKKGEHTISPSLFERDAYQGYLRRHPDEVSTLRYDFQWKGNAKSNEPVTVRLEVRGSRGDLRRPSIFETPLKRSGWGKWAFIALPEADFRALGAIVAWHLTLWQNGTQIAEQKSFLW
jgi:hypothetical protein